MTDQHPHVLPVETQRTRRGTPFLPPPTVLRAIPALYETEATPVGEKVLHLHYVTNGSQWWVAEYDPATGEAFGYACIGDPAGAEWGSFDLGELERLNLVTGWSSSSVTWTGHRPRRTRPTFPACVRQTSPHQPPRRRRGCGS